MKSENLSIKNNTEKQMFLTMVNGGAARLSYSKPQDNVIELTETYVPKESRSKGIAASLTEYALKFADEQNYKIIPSCPFVKNFIEKHPEFSKMVAKN